jgi:hypothetical protein
VSVDLCFWESGDSEELWGDSADGIDHVFVASVRVLEFQVELLRRRPDLVDSVEPELEALSDLSRFILMTLHVSRSGRISTTVELDLGRGLVGYDPESGTAIA